MQYGTWPIEDGPKGNLEFLYGTSRPYTRFPRYRRAESSVDEGSYYPGWRNSARRSATKYRNLRRRFRRTSLEWCTSTAGTSGIEPDTKINTQIVQQMNSNSKMNIKQPDFCWNVCLSTHPNPKLSDSLHINIAFRRNRTITRILYGTSSPVKRTKIVQPTNTDEH